MFKLLTLFVALLALAAASQAGESDDPRLAQSRALAGDLGKQLKGELMAAMQAGGPVQAIEVCNVRAPQIAADLSAGGPDVGRTALKLRNPDNAPTPAQREVMQGFARQLSMRAESGSSEHLPEDFVVQADGSARYMRAIPTGAPCLACHGEKLAPTVQARLNTLYPDDQAIGFQAGALRGAFVVTWPAREAGQ